MPATATVEPAVDTSVCSAARHAGGVLELQSSRLLLRRAAAGQRAGYSDRAPLPTAPRDEADDLTERTADVLLGPLLRGANSVWRARVLDELARGT